MNLHVKPENLKSYIIVYLMNKAPVPHPNPQGVPLLIRPVQQVPLEPAAAGERVGSSSTSLEEQIDKFRFEGDTSGGVQIIHSSDSEEETDRQSCIRPPLLLTIIPEDSSEEEEELSDLKLLLKKRGNKAESKGTGTSQPAVNLPPPPPPPQVSNSALKPIPDLKKKRPIEPEEREVVVPPKAKQQKVGKNHRSKRVSSVESREEPPVADVRQGQCTRSPKLELDGVPFSWETSVRNYDGDYTASLRGRKIELKGLRGSPSGGPGQVRGGRDIGSIKDEAEAQRKLLNETQKNLATEKELVKELGAKLLKAKKALRDAQLAKEATETEKKASYQLGVETTEKGLIEQFASIARDYCDMT
nr:nucleolar and coiled-body phosphoprotein 1-like [Quercus suber]